MKYAMIKSLLIGGENADIELYGFGSVGKVDFEKELRGETEKLTECAKRSRSKVTMYGIEFTLVGSLKTSVLTFHDELLADVSECNLHISEEIRELKVYNLKGVNVGLIVDDDIDSEIIWRKICEYADGIIAVVRDFDSARKARLEKLQAYFDLPAVVSCGGELFSIGAQSAESIDLT